MPLVWIDRFMNPESVLDPQHALISVAEFNKVLSEQHPFAALLGIKVVEIGRGTAQLLLPDNASHTRLGGIVAGPMLMALADLALYAAIVGATGNAHAVTASLSINFMRGAPPGGVVANAEILKVGRLASGEVQIFPENSDDIVAHAISTWAVPKTA